MANRSLFRTLFLINFAITLGFGIADTFFSVYLFGLGARGASLALPLVCYAVSKTLLGPLLGACSDRIGCRKAVALSLGLYLLVSVNYFFCSNLALIALLRLLQGVSCALFRPVLVSLVARCVPGARRASAMGSFDISFYGALGLGPLLGGALKDHWGFRGIFAAASLLCLLALALAWAGIPARESEARRPREAGLGHIWARQGGLRQRRTLRGLLAFIFGRACGISMTATFLPLLLAEKLGLNWTRIGLVMASGTLAITLLLRPVGILSDRIARKPLVVAGGSAVSLLYFLIPTAPGFYQALLLGLGIGCSSVLSQPASSALLVEEGSRHGMGLTVGIFNSVLNLGLVTGPLLGAFLQNRFGLAAVFHGAGLLGLAAVALFVVHAVVPQKASLCRQQGNSTPGIIDAPLGGDTT